MNYYSSLKILRETRKCNFCRCRSPKVNRQCYLEEECPVVRQNAICEVTWRWPANGIHDGVLQELDLRLVSEACKGEIHKLDQEANLCYERDATKSDCSNECILS